MESEAEGERERLLINFNFAHNSCATDATMISFVGATGAAGEM